MALIIMEISIFDLFLISIIASLLGEKSERKHYHGSGSTRFYNSDMVLETRVQFQIRQNIFSFSLS